MPILYRHEFTWWEDNGEWSSNADVKSHINDFSSYPRGVSGVNYRGHGLVTCWQTWNYLGESFTNQDVYDLYNYSNPYEAWLPMVFEIACCCGRMAVVREKPGQPPTDTTGHVEAWLRNPHGGAVGALGATRPTRTDWNHKFDTEIYRTAFDSSFTNFDVGWTINTAKLRTLQAYPGVWEEIRMYHWMGDPENDIYTDWLGYLSATHPSQISTEPTTVDVHVTDQQDYGVGMAVVCLYKEDDIHMAGYTNALGDASFLVDAQSAGALYVTADKHNYGPYQGTIAVVEEPGGGGQASGSNSMIPNTFSFNCASSNPTRGIIRISFGIPKNSSVSLDIYDASGKKLANLLNSRFRPGYYNAYWNGGDSQGKKLASGIYFAVFTAEDLKMTKKIILIR